jgi:hypothetical protein
MSAYELRLQKNKDQQECAVGFVIEESARMGSL